MFAKFGKYLERYIFLIVIALVCIVSTGFIYYGIYSYYIEARENNTKLAIEYISKGDYPKASILLQRAMADGDLEAIEFAAWLECSRGNYTKALKYAREGINQNLASCYEVMGDLALLGYGDATGVAAAMYYFSEGSKLMGGNINDNIGSMIDRAIPIAKNAKDYMNLVRKGITYNSKVANLKLGDALFLGDTIAKNPQKAIEYWQKALQLGEGSANTRLGGAYFHGYVVDQDLQKAKSYYQKAMGFNDPDAYYSYALILLRENPGNIQQQQMAYNFLKKAAIDLNHGPSYNAMALIDYQNKKDASDVYQLFKLSAERGSISGAIYQALFLANGIGVDKNMDRAMEILYKEQELGSVTAEDILNSIAKKEDPKEILDQALAVGVKIIYGDISFSKGAPEAQGYNQGDGFDYFYEQNLAQHEKPVSPNNEKVIASVGNNYPQISNPNTVNINGKLLLIPSIAGIVISNYPTTGAHYYSLNANPPKPSAPPIPPTLQSDGGLQLKLQY